MKIVTEWLELVSAIVAGLDKASLASVLKAYLNPCLTKHRALTVMMTEGSSECLLVCYQDD